MKRMNSADSPRHWYFQAIRDLNSGDLFPSENQVQKGPEQTAQWHAVYRRHHLLSYVPPKLCLLWWLENV